MLLCIFRTKASKARGGRPSRSLSSLPFIFPSLPSHLFEWPSNALWTNKEPSGRFPDVMAHQTTTTLRLRKISLRPIPSFTRRVLVSSLLSSSLPAAFSAHQKNQHADEFADSPLDGFRRSKRCCWGRGRCSGDEEREDVEEAFVSSSFAFYFPLPQVLHVQTSVIER